MKNHLETALSQFDNGFNCAQSILFAFCEDLNIDKEIALKISCGFGGGMGRKEEVCGLVTGGIMAIGIKYGKDSKSGNENTEQTYSKTRQLMDNFIKNHDTYICRKLLDECDLATEEGQKRFKETNLKNVVCKNCMASVVKNLEEIL